MLTLAVSLPGYKSNEKPDYVKIGPKLDSLLEENFSGKSVVIRCISLRDHPNKTLDELAEIVRKAGMDKYDPARNGIGYQVGTVQGKRIDFFGTPTNVADSTDIFTAELLHDFYASAQGDRGYRLRIDLVMIYDSTKLRLVDHLYGEDVEESDGFVFKDSGNKADALLGIIKVL